jgi:hypothetical protein
MKAGRESRNFSKSFEPRRKATRGACYRWHYVVDNASVMRFFNGSRQCISHMVPEIRKIPVAR